MARSPIDPIRVVRRVLEGYAANGVFRGFAAASASASHARFRIVWHHHRELSLSASVPKRTLRFEGLMLDVEPRSPMDQALRRFLTSLRSSSLPEHRRIDPARARLRYANRGGTVSIGVSVVSGDFDYATRRLIHAVNAVFMVFLADGPYLEYRQRVLGVDPEKC